MGRRIDTEVKQTAVTLSWLENDYSRQLFRRADIHQ